jgi:hypothetical protein
MMSGNTSPNGPATTASCDLGRSASSWLSVLTDQPNTPGARKLADLYPAGTFTSPYDFKSGNPDTIVAAGSNINKRATVYEILKDGAGSPTPQNLDYAKKVLVLYLNAELLNGSTGTGHDNYPLTTTEAKDIFNAIVAGSGYSGLTNSGLKTYIDLLYF